MLTVRRASTGVLVLVLGIMTGWYTAGAGGSLERAPNALLVMAVGLGGTGLTIGVILGPIKDRAGILIAVALALSSYYLGTWMNSPFHSIAGDILFMIVSSVPAYLGVVVGIAASRMLRRWRSNGTASV